MCVCVCARAHMYVCVLMYLPQGIMVWSMINQSKSKARAMYDVILTLTKKILQRVVVVSFLLSKYDFK